MTSTTHMADEVSEFNADVSFRFDQDQHRTTTRNFGETDKHKKMLLLHSSTAPDKLKYLRSSRSKARIYMLFTLGNCKPRNTESWEIFWAMQNFWS